MSYRTIESILISRSGSTTLVKNEKTGSPTSTKRRRHGFVDNEEPSTHTDVSGARSMAGSIGCRASEKTATANSICKQQLARVKTSVLNEVKDGKKSVDSVHSASHVSEGNSLATAGDMEIVFRIFCVASCGPLDVLYRYCGSDHKGRAEVQSSSDNGGR